MQTDERARHATQQTAQEEMARFMSTMTDALARITEKVYLLESARLEDQFNTSRAAPLSGHIDGKADLDVDELSSEAMLMARTALHPNRPLPRRMSTQDAVRVAATKSVEYVNTRPPYGHIRLSTLDLGEVIQFFKSVTEYVTVYSIPLPVGQLINPSVRNQLFAYYRDEGLVPHDFLTLAPERILSFVQRYCQPRDRASFRDALDKNVNFRWKGYITQDTFEQFHSRLMSYCENFSLWYDFLSEGNAAATPEVSKRDGGILRLFLDKIPNNYGYNLYLDMREKSFKTFDEFLVAFYSHTKMDLENIKVTRQVLSKTVANPLTEGAAKTPAMAVDSTPAQRFPFTNQPRREFQRAPQQPHQSTQPRLNALASSTVSDTIESMDEQLREPDSDDEEEELAAPAQASEDSDDESLEHANMLAAIDTANRIASHHNTGQAARPMMKRYPCLSLLLDGKCARGDKCGRSHETAELMELWHTVNNKLKSSKYAPRQILPRPLNVIDDVLLSIAKGRCVSLTALGEVLTSVVNLTAVCLFDTGAQAANYISQTFLEENLLVLSPYMEECATDVMLGDSTTRLQITHRLKLNVVFRDSNGNSHSISDDFYVIPHKSNDIIIGLPAISRELAMFFLYLFGETRAALGDNSCFSCGSHLSTGKDFAMLTQGDFNEELCVTETSASQPESQTSSEVLLSPPWPAYEEAPEELATPMPSAHPFALQFLGKPFQESFDEFCAMLPTHVSPDFAASTDVIKCLKEWGWRAFIPITWTGINGIDPLELDWLPDLPKELKPRVFPINPKLFATAAQEFERLKSYFYVLSTSPVSSGIVIANKATPPYVRFCGNYVAINVYILANQQPIPQVRYELHKLIGFKLYLDLDMANAFHQLKLGDRTSNLLSVSTPWGQYRPLFLPEGVKVATGILQSVVREIFADFAEWTIIIYDNFLILANDYQDAYDKLVRVLNRCIERNLVLKMSKSWLGVGEVSFFGYKCSPRGFTLSEDRKQEIQKIPFPSSLKQMQSFLGMALFFAPFISDYATKAADLNDMVHKDFPWSAPTSWKRDYKQIFSDFKILLLDCLLIHYPDYELNWTVRCDASDRGVGAILLQETTDNDSSTKVLQPVSVVSSKFSDVATRWSTIEKEAYAIYFAVHSFSYYLIGKSFILETDHANLVWINSSEVPKIVRWRIFMQPFSFLIRHIPGKMNVAADYLSRSFAQLLSLSHEEMFKQVHGTNGRGPHCGAARTYERLNKVFPGHGMSVRETQDLVLQCPVCQKVRLGASPAAVTPSYRHLHVNHPHAAIGVDLLTVTPPDKAGNQVIIVIVVFFTKYVFLYPVADYTAVTLARALFVFYSTFGIYDTIHSDPGSNLTSHAVALLHEWFAIKHVFSLVDRHESCGVEATNREVLRHLRALVTDSRLHDTWSSDEVLPLIQYYLNSAVHSETGFTPLELQFGSAAALYHTLPAPQSGTLSHDYLQKLNDNLRTVTEASLKYQQELVQSKETKTPSNVYQKGDLILRVNDSPISKLAPKYLGPYRVISHYKNDVQAQHLTQGSIETFHSSKIKPFFGSDDEAKRLAMTDYDQYLVQEFRAYRGDPLHRTSVQFEVLFADGSVVWLYWSLDLFRTVQYEDFCRAHPQLRVLVETAEAGVEFRRKLNRQPITEVHPGEVCYFDLRGWSETWYEQLDLPDLFHIRYVLEARYNKLTKARTSISVYVPALRATYTEDHYKVFAYGAIKVLGPNMVLLDSDFIRHHPELKKLLSK
jgi:hypothetical protein